MSNKLNVFNDVFELLKYFKPTPLVRINNLVRKKNVQVYAKLEWYNPFDSIKDRIIPNIIERSIKPNINILFEVTSGNTGIALAGFYAHKFKVLILAPKDISEEKLLLMKLLGADVKVLDVREEELLAYAENIAKKSNVLYVNQFNNSLNPDAHYNTTGPEIWYQTKGKITHLVAGMGTSGTIVGVAKYLKSKKPTIKIIGVIPKDKIPGLTKVKEVKPAFYAEKLIDEIIEVSFEDAVKTAMKVIRYERLLAGISSGAAMFAALKVVKEIDEGLVVVIFPDSALRYLSVYKNYLNSKKL